MLRFDHFNFNVLNLEKSLEFYKQALGFTEARRKEGTDFTLVFLTDGETGFSLELTYLHNRTTPYNLGELEYHLAVKVDEYEETYKKHKDMGIICYENPEMGIYFIHDPDGYWIEVIPQK